MSFWISLRVWHAVVLAIASLDVHWAHSFDLEQLAALLLLAIEFVLGSVMGNGLGIYGPCGLELHELPHSSACLVIAVVDVLKDCREVCAGHAGWSFCLDQVWCSILVLWDLIGSLRGRSVLSACRDARGYESGRALGTV